MTLNSNERTKCEIFSRVMGYYRPRSEFNIGKKQEHLERTDFEEQIAMKTIVGVA